MVKKDKIMWLARGEEIGQSWSGSDTIQYSKDRDIEFHRQDLWIDRTGG